MKQCTHKRAGIVTNQPDGYDSHRAHAARSTCSRPECIEAAKRWVAAETNETAVLLLDADRKARAS